MMVEKYHWFTDEEVIDAIAVCQALPGVIAINMATFIGNKKQRWAGALVSTIGVILPSFIIISAIVILLNHESESYIGLFRMPAQELQHDEE